MSRWPIRAYPRLYHKKLRKTELLTERVKRLLVKSLRVQYFNGFCYLDFCFIHCFNLKDKENGYFLNRSLSKEPKDG